MKPRSSRGSRPAIQGGLLLTVSLCLLLTPSPKADRIRMLIALPVRPVQWAAFSIGTGLRGLGDKWREWRNDQREKSLRNARAEIQRLENELVTTRELLREAQRKLENLAFEAPVPLNTIAMADVIAYDASDWRKSIVIDRGLRARIEPGMVAIWDGALVGRVTAAGPFCAQIQLITEPASRVAVRTAKRDEKEKRVPGVLYGTGLNTCAMRYVSYIDDIKQGDIVVTDGTDGNFPAGLVVGTCTASERHTGEMMRNVTITPAMMPARLESVVIVDWTPPDKTLAAPDKDAGEE